MLKEKADPGKKIFGPLYREGKFRGEREALAASREHPRVQGFF